MGGDTGVKERCLLLPLVSLSFLMAPKCRLGKEDGVGTTVLVTLSGSTEGKALGWGVQMLLTGGHSSQGSKL